MTVEWPTWLVGHSSVPKIYLNSPLKKSVSYIVCFNTDGKWTVKKKKKVFFGGVSLFSEKQHNLAFPAIRAMVLFFSPSLLYPLEDFTGVVLGGRCFE